MRRSLGVTRFAPTVLKRGITHDPAFEEWANKVSNLRGGPGAEVSLKVYRCWSSQYTAIPELDANANSVAVETLVLENEGWERDRDVTEPEESSL